MKIRLSQEEAKTMLKHFSSPHFTNTRNYITVCEVDPAWIAEILPPPLQPDEPLVTFALSKGDQFCGTVCGVQSRYKDLVGSWGLAYVMDTDLAVIYGREGLGEPKKLGVTTVEETDKKYVGTVSRFGKELVRIEADIAGPGPEGFGGGTMDNFHFKYGIRADGSGLDTVRLVHSHFENKSENPVMMENCTIKLNQSPFDVYGEIPVKKVVTCFAATLDMRGSAKYLTEVDGDAFLPYAFYKHDDYRLTMSID
jgi:hypothetical protein